MSRSPAARAERAAFAVLAAALALVVIPQLGRVPPWTVALLGLFGAWRLLAEIAGWPLPDRQHRVLLAFKQLLALAVFVAVAASFGGQLGRDAGVALLVVLLGLKLIEARGTRDHYVLVFLGYFLVVTNFLYAQRILDALVMLAGVLGLTASLAILNDSGRAPGLRRALALAATMLAQAAPLMVALFVLFPRLPGPLWGLPRDAGTGLTGISEEMTMGAISRLGLSDAIAFRVEFDGPLPPATARYWRGPVLWHTDGRTWRPGRPSAAEADPIPVHGTGPRVHYTVTLEPHEHNWLYALEMPAATPTMARRTRDQRLLTRRRVTRRLRYALSAYTEYRLDEAAPAELGRALQLAPRHHPRARDLGRHWRATLDDPQAIVEQALRHFAEEDFHYTLQPPLARADPVDEFLFDSRRGFCEHFAGAFTVLMRAAGIPARIVIGYQGGAYNPVGDYLVVRQHDAHAWTEVWLAGRGWVRIDPTAAVAPARVERGIDIALPDARTQLPLGLPRIATLESVWRGLRDAADAIGNAWNQWVLGYGVQRQAQLLQRLGMPRPDWTRLGLWLTLALGLIMAVLAAFMLRRPQRARADPARALYDRFCARLARHGLDRAPWEGPLAFAARVRREHGDGDGSVARISALYVQARYQSEAAALARLQHAVEAFRAPARAGSRIDMDGQTR